MSAAGLQSLSGGRFVLGIGVSSPAIVEGWMGLRFEPSPEGVERHVALLRRMLSGAKVSHAGPGPRVDGFRLQIDPGRPVPVHVGALGPRMCRLAGRIADGVLFFLMTPDGVRRALEEVGAGAREAGREPDEVEAFIRLPVAANEPEDVTRFMARRLLTGYAVVPAYGASLARQGFEGQARAIAGAWAAGERERATELFDDEMLERFFLLGDADACRERIDAYRAAGVTTPTLMPLSFAGTPEERAERIAAMVEALRPGGDVNRGPGDRGPTPPGPGGR